MENNQKDFWDKANIVLHPLNGLLTATAVALLGYFTTTALRQREAADTNQRVFTEMMTTREQAESSLRKDMFLSIMQTFQQPAASSLEGKMLDLELLAYNFHESLNIKPLFAHMTRQIQLFGGPDMAEYNSRLKRVAREITTRQMVLLEQVGKKFSRSVDFDKLDASPGGLELEPETLTLNNIKREFTLTVTQVDRERRELTLEMAVRTVREDAAGNSAGVQRLTFRAGFFDFPMIDNTRLSDDQRAAVILNQASNDSAEITLVYFPGSYASLKERISYDEVLDKLRGSQ